MKADNTLADFTAEATIAEISKRNPIASKLLASIGISLPEKREETLRSFCRQRQWKEEDLLQWIRNKSEIMEDNIFDDEKGSDDDRPLGAWIDYLREHFISPNKSLLNDMEERVKQIEQYSSFEDGKVSQMITTFQKLSEGIKFYYRFEEQKLFPLVEKLLNSKASNLKHGVVQDIERSFDIVKRDQKRLGRIVKNARMKLKSMKIRSGDNSSLFIQNKNMSVFYNSLSAQFEKEKAFFIPRIREEINTKR